MVRPAPQGGSSLGRERGRFQGPGRTHLRAVLHGVGVEEPGAGEPLGAELPEAAALQGGEVVGRVQHPHAPEPRRRPCAPRRFEPLPQPPGPHHRPRQRHRPRLRPRRHGPAAVAARAPLPQPAGRGGGAPGAEPQRRGGGHPAVILSKRGKRRVRQGRLDRYALWQAVGHALPTLPSSEFCRGQALARGALPTEPGRQTPGALRLGRWDVNENSIHQRDVDDAVDHPVGQDAVAPLPIVPSC